MVGETFPGADEGYRTAPWQAGLYFYYTIFHSDYKYLFVCQVHLFIY